MGFNVYLPTNNLTQQISFRSRLSSPDDDKTMKCQIIALIFTKLTIEQTQFLWSCVTTLCRIISAMGLYIWIVELLTDYAN